MATDLLDFNSVYADDVTMAINPETINFAHGSYVSSMAYLVGPSTSNCCRTRK